MNDSEGCAPALVGFLLGVSLGVVGAGSAIHTAWTESAIRHGFLEHNARTGELEWKNTPLTKEADDG